MKALDEIKTRMNAATPGPWKAMENPEKHVVFILTSKGIEIAREALEKK